MMFLFIIGNCTLDEWDNHWCSSYIGVQKPLFIGFSSKLRDPCGSPSVAVDVYRSEYVKQSWVQTDNKEFKDKKSYLVNLTRSLVSGKSLRMRKAVAMTSRWTAVYLEAHVKKSGRKTNFEVSLDSKTFIFLFIHLYMLSLLTCCSTFTLCLSAHLQIFSSSFPLFFILSIHVK